VINVENSARRDVVVAVVLHDWRVPNVETVAAAIGHLATDPSISQ
jgi:hypothetical protein